MRIRLAASRRRHRSRRRGPDPGERLRGGRRGARRRRRTARSGRRAVLDDLGPDPEALARADRTRVPAASSSCTSTACPSTWTPILALARERDLVVLEDCSHAHGATLDGRAVGTFGDRRRLQPGRRQEPRRLRRRRHRQHRRRRARRAASRSSARTVRRRRTTHVLYGGNSRLDELHAAMLRVKLRVLGARNDRRAAIAAYYSERLADRVVVPPADPRRTHVYHQYVIRTPERDALRRYLAEAGIETGIHYPVPIHRQPAWRERFGEATEPAAGGTRGRGDPLPARPPRPHRRRGRARGGQRRGFLRLSRSTPTLSIVVPVYDEEGNVGPLHARAHRRGTTPRPARTRSIFVNDGSRDAHARAAGGAGDRRPAPPHRRSRRQLRRGSGAVGRLRHRARRGRRHARRRRPERSARHSDAARQARAKATTPSAAGASGARRSVHSRACCRRASRTV